MEKELINTSGLSRLFNSTTTRVENTLTRAKIKPVREVKQPSGRRYLLWDRKKAVAALEVYQKEREALTKQREADKLARLTKMNLKNGTSFEPTPAMTEEIEALIASKVQDATEALREQIEALKEAIEALGKAKSPRSPGKLNVIKAVPRELLV